MKSLMSGTDTRELPPRSLLFVPADRAAEYLPKAEAAGPDAIIVDLEDAVAEADKDRARQTLLHFIRLGRPALPLFLRVNPPGTPWFEEDIAAAAQLGVDGLILPKCSGSADVMRAVEAFAAAASNNGQEPAPAILPTIETPRGVLAAYEIATADEAVIGLAFGAEDFAAALGVRRTASGRELFVARSHVVLAAAAAGRWAIDSPCLEFRRLEFVRRETLLARGLGFAGKFVIHPAQVRPVHDAFRVGVAELEEARRIVARVEAAAGDGPETAGVQSVDGRMVDRPVLVAALRVVHRAERYGIEVGDGVGPGGNQRGGGSDG